MRPVIVFAILILSSIFLFESHTDPRIQGELSLSPSRPRYAADGTYVEIDTVPTHVTSYTDTAARPEDGYYYRVRSYNCTVHSDYSNEASISTGTVQSSGGSGGGGCSIATAAFGSPLAPQVAILREFRDRVLMKSAVGRSIVHVYYRYSPALAAVIERDGALRAIVRFSLLPLIAYSYWSLVLGHGITLTIFTGLFLMLVIVGCTKMRKGQGGPSAVELT